MKEINTSLPQEQIDFYRKCADILKIEYIESFRYSNRTRWNHRNPGNGRFEGYGIIRWFSSNYIHVAFNNPTNISKVFTSQEDCLSWLVNTFVTQQIP